MAKYIYKYTVPVDDRVHGVTLDAGVKILHVDCTGNYAMVEFWALHDDTQTETEERWFQVVGTGHPLPPDAAYVGSVVTSVGLVWHLMEVS